MSITSSGFQESNVFFLSYLCTDLLLILFWLLVIFAKEAIFPGPALWKDSWGTAPSGKLLSKQTTPFCVGRFLSLWYQALTQLLCAESNPSWQKNARPREDSSVWLDNLVVTFLPLMKTTICRAAFPVLFSDALTHCHPAQCLCLFSTLICSVGVREASLKHCLKQEVTRLDPQMMKHILKDFTWY